MIEFKVDLAILYLDAGAANDGGVLDGVSEALLGVRILHFVLGGHAPPVVGSALLPRRALAVVCDELGCAQLAADLRDLGGTDLDVLRGHGWRLGLVLSYRWALVVDSILQDVRRGGAQALVCLRVLTAQASDVDRRVLGLLVDDLWVAPLRADLVGGQMVPELLQVSGVRPSALKESR